MIRREAIPPGGRLPTEHRLARRFHVSRSIVREAIQGLKALGIVESRPKTGLRVLPFDPTAHEAVMHEPGEGAAHVVDVMRAGYRWKGRVLRPAMVKVAGN